MELTTVILILLLLSFTFVSCRATPPATIDFGHGHIQLKNKFRFDPRQTHREPHSARFAFDLVNDTHINGQTSYAEKLIVSRLAPSITTTEFRTLLNRAIFDPLYTKNTWATQNDGPLELQFSNATYERHPVTEPATLVRIIDWPNRRLISWYGYTKHYDATQATTYLKQIFATLELDPALESRFPAYEKWKGNDWMDAYFANQPLLTEAIRPLGFHFPDQGFIGDVSTWQTSGPWMLALDGERPAHLHLVQLNTQAPCASLNDISPDLRLSFTQSFPNKKPPECFRLHKLNFWLPPPPNNNPFTSWLKAIQQSSQP